MIAAGRAWRLGATSEPLVIVDAAAALFATIVAIWWVALLDTEQHDDQPR